MPATTHSLTKSNVLDELKSHALLALVLHDTDLPFITFIYSVGEQVRNYILYVRRECTYTLPHTYKFGLLIFPIALTQCLCKNI